MGKTSVPLLLIVGSRYARWFARKSNIEKYVLNSCGHEPDVAEQLLRIKKTGMSAKQDKRAAPIEENANLTETNLILVYHGIEKSKRLQGILEETVALRIELAKNGRTQSMLLRVGTER